MTTPERTQFPGGLGIGQCWHDRSRTPAVCRVVGIDPALHVVEVENQAGQLEQDSIEHFLSTHDAQPEAEAC